jgi:hypothetical protein
VPLNPRPREVERETATGAEPNGEAADNAARLVIVSTRMPRSSLLRGEEVPMPGWVWLVIGCLIGVVGTLLVEFGRTLGFLALIALVIAGVSSVVAYYRGRASGRRVAVISPYRP